MKPYDDPIALGITARAGVILEPPPPADYATDAVGSPRETLNLSHYGRVMAAREELRRSAE
jgi:hypothetical protein